MKVEITVTVTATTSAGSTSQSTSPPLTQILDLRKKETVLLLLNY